MGPLYRKNERWHLRYKDGHGRWRDTATQAPTKTQTRSILHDLEAHADRRRRGLEPLTEHRKQVTFGEALDEWKTEVSSRLRSTTIIGFGEKLREAMATSSSELLFPAEDGSQRAPDSALHKMLRRAMGRAGLVQGYNHACRRKGCGYSAKKSHGVPDPCPH